MKLSTHILLVIIAINFHLYGQKNIDRDNHEPLSETPLYPIPAEMTFEEYQDMNRRMSLAVAWSSIPVPGLTHYYAGEKKKAKQLYYIGLGGLACIIAGAGSEEEKFWPDTTGNLIDNYVIHNEGQYNEKWFERNVELLPGVHHYSWLDLGRKIRTYRDYWSQHWQSLYNIEQEDTAENNMFFGKPHSSKISANFKAVRGVFSEGLRMTGAPAAMAGASLCAT